MSSKAQAAVPLSGILAPRVGPSSDTLAHPNCILSLPGGDGRILGRGKFSLEPGSNCHPPNQAVPPEVMIKPSFLLGCLNPSHLSPVTCQMTFDK